MQYLNVLQHKNKKNKTKECTYPLQLPAPTKGLFPTARCNINLMNMLRLGLLQRVYHKEKYLFGNISAQNDGNFEILCYCFDTI